MTIRGFSKKHVVLHMKSSDAVLKIWVLVADEFDLLAFEQCYSAQS